MNFYGTHLTFMFYPIGYPKCARKSLARYRAQFIRQTCSSYYLRANSMIWLSLNPTCPHLRRGKPHQPYQSVSPIAFITRFLICTGNDASSSIVLTRVPLITSLGLKLIMIRPQATFTSSCTPMEKPAVFNQQPFRVIAGMRR